MKNKRLTVLALVILLIIMTFTACSQTEVGDNPPELPPNIDSEDAPEPEPIDDLIESPSPAQDRPAAAPFQSEFVTRYPVEAAALLQPEYGVEDTAVKTVASGANRFALRLSNELASKASGENFVCSPYSVWLPLAALLNATDESHKAALLDSLGAQGVVEADINRAASRMLYDLTKEREREYGISDPLHIANAVFVDKNAILSRNFVQSFLDYFRGQALNVDFSSDEAVREVNRWASENTEGLITDIVEGFSPGTVAAIANAIYFSDRWSWEFNPDETTKGVFHSPGEDTTAMFMKHEGDGFYYYEDDRIQATSLSFNSGGVMYILLPKDGDASGLLASFDETYFTMIQRGSSERTGKLLLPRFRIASDVIQLGGPLKDLGVPLFDAQSAPLTGLLEGNSSVSISSAVQKAVIEVDEKGTTAAAVTVMVMTGGGPTPTDPFEMVCDKPFVFLLCDRTYDGGNQILFTGVVNRPE